MTGRFSSSRVLISAIGLSSALSAAGSAQAAAGLATIRLTSERDVLLADGKNSATLTAEVRDDRGSVVADGTLVRFTTTNGRLDTTVAATRNGVARVTLTAADLPGTALVTANLDGAGSVPAQITLSFSSEIETVFTGSNWVRVDGSDYVGYAADAGLIQAMGKNGGARVTYRGSEIHGDTLELNVRENRVLALGNVTLARGGEKREYSSLRYDLTTGEGTGERLDDGKPQVLMVQGARLQETAAPSADAAGGETFTLADISGASLTVKARSIALEPNVRLQFRRAEFYLDGNKILALPYHVMALGQESLWAEQVVGYGAHGLTVDFPLHYDVRPEAIGTLHIRRSPRVSASAYSTRPGWSLDLEQAYNRGGAADGTLEVTGVTRRDWGARWTHTQRVDGRTHGQFYADFPNHSDLFGNTTLTRAFRGFSATATATGSRTAAIGGGAGGDWRGQVYAETDARTVGGVRQLQYTLNLSAARNGFYGPNAPPAYTTRTTGVRLFTAPLALGRATKLSQSLSLGQTWTSQTARFARSGASVLGTVSLTHAWGRLGTTTLTYDHTQTPESGIYRRAGRHRLGANLFFANGARWSLMLSGVRTLDQPLSSVYGNCRFSLGGPWSGRVTVIASRLSTFRYHEVEYALIRRVGGRDIAVYYSTTARRLQLDLTGARF